MSRRRLFAQEMDVMSALRRLARCARRAARMGLPRPSILFLLVGLGLIGCLVFHEKCANAATKKDRTEKTSSSERERGPAALHLRASETVQAPRPPGPGGASEAASTIRAVDDPSPDREPALRPEVFPELPGHPCSTPPARAPPAILA